jgi:hypothetical protein
MTQWLTSEGLLIDESLNSSEIALLRNGTAIQTEILSNEILPATIFDLVLRNPGVGFNIVLSETGTTILVYVGADWLSRYRGVRSDSQIYVGNETLR